MDLRHSTTERFGFWLHTLVMGVWVVCVSSVARDTLAQNVSMGGRHPFDRSDSPPGMVGTSRILQAGHAIQRYQPVRFEGPEGMKFALSGGPDFLPTEAGPVSAAILVGPAYRLKVTDIPQEPGLELFPTIELLDHLCPPPQLQTAFPIPIVFTAEDLEMAAAGGMVTRVIYLEDPQSALPITDKPGTQRHFDVTGPEDPLHVADQLGKPIAIVRIGSRVAPEQPELMAEFLYGNPPWVPIVTAPPIETSPGTPVPIPYGGAGDNGFAAPPQGSSAAMPPPDRMSPRR